MINREIIFKAAHEAGLVRFNSCCEIKDKLCSMDQWEGNLEAFANALIRLLKEKNDQK